MPLTHINTAGIFLQFLVLFKILGLPMSEYKLNAWRYVTRLMLALSEFYLQRTVRSVKESPFFGLMIDLSSDRVSKENMLVYVTYWDQTTMRSVVEYLCCVRLIAKDGGSVFDALSKICTACGLDLKTKLRTFCADGDGSMQGFRVGVVGRMRMYCDCLISMHCAAHKHVLAVQDAVKLCPLLKDIDSLLTLVHGLFLRAPKYVALWELFAKKHGLKAFTFPIFVPTRWFSRAGCIYRLLDNFAVLVRFLFGLTRPGTKNFWKKAESVLEKLTDARTVVLLHALGDILRPLESSRKLFETSGCKICDLTAELNVLSEQLDDLEGSATSLEEFGDKHMQLLMDVSNELAIHDGSIVLKWPRHDWSVKLNAAALGEDMIDNLCGVVKAIRDNLSDRFPADERDFLNLFDIFQLESFHSVRASNVHTFGDTEIAELVDMLSKKQAAGRQFYCKVPFIEPSRKAEVRCCLS
jgi:hypothetical protein